jgi:hypothetical protein
VQHKNLALSSTRSSSPRLPSCCFPLPFLRLLAAYSQLLVGVRCSWFYGSTTTSKVKRSADLELQAMPQALSLFAKLAMVV